MAQKGKRRKDPPREGGQEGGEEIDPEEGGCKESRSAEGKAHQARDRALGDSSAEPLSATRLLRRGAWLGHRRQQRDEIRNGRFGRPHRYQRRDRRLAQARLTGFGGYAQVASIPAVLERIESFGGKTIMPRTDIGAVVMGLYEDPEGNLMGLIEPR